LIAKTRREFTPEFKREAVALLESSGRPQMQIGGELGIQPSMRRCHVTGLGPRMGRGGALRYAQAAFACYQFFLHRLRLEGLQGLRETRRRWVLKVLWATAWAGRNRWADPCDLNQCIFRSRRRVGWCEFSARLFRRCPWSWQAKRRSWRVAAPYDPSLSVVMVSGAKPCFLISFAEDEGLQFCPCAFGPGCRALHLHRQQPARELCQARL